MLAVAMNGRPLPIEHGFPVRSVVPGLYGYVSATLVAGDSYVTRLRDLREAEDHIAAGVPLIVSIAFGRNQLAGAPISASNGHLLVIAGFEADGDVVVNDPAGATNSAVRRVYDRAQFERIWLSASGGTAYVIKNS